MNALAPSLRCVTPIEEAAGNANRLARAVAGLVLRSAASRFGCRIHDVYDAAAPWPSNSAKARAAAIYVLRVEMNFSTEDVEILTGASRRHVRRTLTRIEEIREDNREIDHWLGELAAAVKGEPG